MYGALPDSWVSDTLFKKKHIPFWLLHSLRLVHSFDSIHSRVLQRGEEQRKQLEIKTVRRY